VEANVREAHDTPVASKKFVSASGSLSPELASVIKVETYNMVAAVQKLLQGDPVSVVLACSRQIRAHGLLQDPSEHFRTA
jgi:hypothetical protein